MTYTIATLNSFSVAKNKNGKAAVFLDVTVDDKRTSAYASLENGALDVTDRQMQSYGLDLVEDADKAGLNIPINLKRDADTESWHLASARSVSQPDVLAEIAARRVAA
jgi:hypothetical protein